MRTQKTTKTGGKQKKRDRAQRPARMGPAARAGRTDVVARLQTSFHSVDGRAARGAVDSGGRAAELGKLLRKIVNALEAENSAHVAPDRAVTCPLSQLDGRHLTGI